jgi:16S rRNA (uracil1498-N3)-methyltransferase
VAIGPEGGFSDEEFEAAIAAGWHAIGLGPTILRVETAGLAACSAILALNQGALA